MKKMILYVFGFIFVLIGCAAGGPLLKPGFSFRSGYINNHPELAVGVKNAILKGEVIKGMTKDEVRASWGKPTTMDDLSETPHAWWYEENAEGWWYKPFPISLEPTRFVKFKNENK